MGGLRRRLIQNFFQMEGLWCLRRLLRSILLRWRNQNPGASESDPWLEKGQLGQVILPVSARKGRYIPEPAPLIVYPLVK